MWFDRGGGDPVVDRREGWILIRRWNGKWRREEKRRRKGFFSFVGTCQQLLSSISRAFLGCLLATTGEERMGRRSYLL